jgi:signal peptidase I
VTTDEPPAGDVRACQHERVDAVAGPDAAPASRRPSWLLRAGAVLVVALLVRAFVVHPEVVESTSMEPTLREGDVVLVLRSWLAERVAPPGRGDLVVGAEPGSGDPVVKRVVGLAGDLVEIQDAVTTVNGAEVDEPYVDRSRIDALYFGPVTVPADGLFVMGDNRSRSIDSRDWGPLPHADVDGRVVLRIWPWWR